ncbi:MAG TPA: efflux RND transporter permease subunit, partial [Proteobacteria bacterium]|nr:efflux RND transporter permease subunit [Pseudomonadota bacterium]
VIIALLASLLEAFIILPSHLADFVKPKKKKDGKPDFSTRFFNLLLQKYTSLLKKLLSRKCLSISGAALFIVVFFFIGFKFIPLVMFSGRGVEQFYIRVEAPAGTTLESVSEMARPVEELVAQMSPEELDAYTTSVGSLVEEGGYDPGARYGSNYAQIAVYLSPTQKRKRSADEISDSLRPALKKLEEELGFDRLYIYILKEGPPTGKSIDVNVRGKDFAVLSKISESIKEFLRALKGVSDVTDSYKFDKYEAIVEIDSQKAMEAGLTVEQIASSVRNVFEGGLATKIRLPRAEKEIEVRVRFPELDRKTFEAFDRLLIPNNQGKLIPFNRICEIKRTTSLSNIPHLDGERIINITAEVDNKNITSFEANTAIEEAFKDVPKENMGYGLRFGGEHEENVKSIMSLFQAMMLAFLMIYVILATQFRSLIQPFIVMLAIPFGIVGVVLAFLVHGESWSFLALMGMIGLLGVVVNDSIVLMSFINTARLKGQDRRTAVLNAGRMRLRPVVLTTVTTAFGLMPTAYGIGGFDPFLRPMALAISWGLIVGTIWTLLLLPCIYVIVDELMIKITHHTSLIFNGYKRRNNASNTGPSS